MVEQAKKLLFFNGELTIRDVFLFFSITLAIAGWWHKIELNDATAEMKYNGLQERVCYIENEAIPKVIKMVESNRNLEDKRYDRQSAIIAENSKTNAKIDILVTEIKTLNNKINDLIDGKYNIKK